MISDDLHEAIKASPLTEADDLKPDDVKNPSLFRIGVCAGVAGYLADHGIAASTEPESTEVPEAQ